MPLVYKQALAIIDSRTTIICLDVHGVVVPVDAPFETLGGDFMAPPFHVHCRTLVGPHMPGFISEARRAANKELQNRPMKERRKGPDGPAGSIPGPDSKNPPSGFSRRDDNLAKLQEDLLFEEQRKLKAVGKGAQPDDWEPTAEKVPKNPPKPVPMDDAATMIDAHYVQPSEDEHRAIGLYKAGMTWSQDLRAGRASEYTMERVNQVKSLIAKQVPFAEPVALYRGLSRQFVGQDLAVLVGTVMKDEGIVSTSLDKETAGLFAGTSGGVLLEIICPAGTRALSVNHGMLADQSAYPAEYRIPPQVLGNEAEMVLAPGTAFKVLQVTRRKVEHGYVETLQVMIVDG